MSAQSIDAELKAIGVLRDKISIDLSGLAFMAFHAEKYEEAILDLLKSLRDQAVKEVAAE